MNLLALNLPHPLSAATLEYALDIPLSREIENGLIPFLLKVAALSNRSIRSPSVADPTSCSLPSVLPSLDTIW
jgi:hypothetical protein